MKTHTAAGPRSLVPFPRASAIVGYAVISGVLLLVVLEFVSWAVLGAKDWYAAKKKMDAFARIAGPLHCRGGECPGSIQDSGASPALDGYAWADDYWHVFRATSSSRCNAGCLVSDPVPYVEWGNGIVSSRFLNSERAPLGVVRRTISPSGNCSGRELAVWVFGGSEVWGWGVADVATIPSLLAQQLEANGTCAQVTNFGVLGYATTQELVQLALLLRGGQRPDVAVFLDGFNEAFDAAIESVPGIPMRYTSAQLMAEKPGVRLLEQTYTARALLTLARRLGFAGEAQKASDPSLDGLSATTVDVYEHNCQVIATLGRGYGFKSLFFWQPSLYSGRKPLAPFEQAVMESKSPYAPVVSAVHREAARRAPGWSNFEDLAGTFDAVSKTVYIDDVHTGPEGNRMIAARMANAIVTAAKDHAPAATRGTATAPQR